MRLPITARVPFRALGVLVAAAALLSACAADSTAPAPGAGDRTAPAPLNPSKSLVGAADGTYTFTVNPSRGSSLIIGQSMLVIPARSICRLADSGYGAAFWNAPCEAETAPVTITATVHDASSLHPRIDFEPAMRFAPKKQVALYMYVDAPAQRDGWNILYCSTDTTDSCVDESLGDPTLGVYVQDQWVYRRIKHFSGYVVTTLVEDVGDMLGY